MPMRDYSGGEMMRMQREAEQRVIEMRNRARSATTHGFENAGNSGWSSATGRSRQLPSQPLRPSVQETPTANEVMPQKENTLTHEAASSKHEDAAEEMQEQTEGDAEKSGEAKLGGEESQTILGDVMGALGVGDDTLLIIGLLLILVNQRADTTLLLALAYLLI